MGAARKYLFYLVGEFVLIVTGILVALQINNWNENVKSHRIEQHLLEGLKEELMQNKTLLENVILHHVVQPPINQTELRC